MKLNWISITILFLLVMNLGMVGSFVIKQKKLEQQFGKEPPRIIKNKRQKFDKETFLKSTLLLNDEQYKHISAMQDTFFHSSRVLLKSIRELDDSLIREMTKPNIDKEELERLSQEIGKQTTELKSTFYHHYFEVSEVCDTAQQEKLDSFMNTFTHEHKKNKHRDGNERPHKRRYRNKHK